MADSDAAATKNCGACGHANPAEAKFCGECGQRVDAPPACPECGAQNPTGQRFCNSCGAALAGGAATSEPATDQPAGERKQVTVVFADVMGSMELAEQTDPERWREIMNGLFQQLAEAVDQYEGTVDKFTGDGLMALFGAPVAHEDHAQRACIAALEMQARAAGYAAEVRRDAGIELSLRIGINSGEVVAGSIGAGGGNEYTAVGHTVGLAQRMESLAESDAIFITEHTERLVSGRLDLADLGVLDVKGSSRPLQVYRLDGAGSVAGRLDAESERGRLSQFVGRGDELDQLISVLDHALAGEGGVVGIVGEAGLGKSRICHELVAICEARGLKVCQAQCQAHTSNVPLFPVRQLMRSYFDVGLDDPDDVARDKVAQQLLAIDDSLEADICIAYDFLAIADPNEPGPQMNPEARRRRLFDLVRHGVRMSGAPVVNIIEDLHWIDPASEVFVAAFADAVPGSSSLLVTNFRPEYDGEWMKRSHYRQIPLSPLAEPAVRGMLGELLGGDPSLDGLAEMIFERTGGNPFFTEETVRELEESGALEGERGALRLAHQIEELSVPATVQSVLAARIDRLTPAAKATLGAAAAIGAEFCVDVLERVVEIDEAALGGALDELVRGEFVYITELYPETEYSFRHPLTREVAYGSQLVADRARAHVAIARAMEEMHPDELDERAALIGSHYEAADERQSATEWHARAAAWAGFNDPHVAYRGWKRVRDLADELPDCAESRATRLVTRLMLVALGWRLGVPAEESEREFNEGMELAEQDGNCAAMAQLYVGRGATLGLAQGRMDEFARLVDKATQICGDLDQPELLATINAAGVYPYCMTGRLEDSVKAANTVIELTEGQPLLGTGLVVNSPRALAFAFRALPLGYLGRLREARESIDHGIELCREYDNETLSWSLGMLCSEVSGGARAFGPDTLAAARESQAIAEAHGDQFSRLAASGWLGAMLAHAGDFDAGDVAWSTIETTLSDRPWGSQFDVFTHDFRAAALVAIGNFEEAIAEAETGLENARTSSVFIQVPGLLCSLAEALAGRAGPGDLERAAESLDEAEAVMTEHGNRLTQAWVTIARAKIKLAGGDEAGYNELLDEAERQATEIDAQGFLQRIEALRNKAPA